MTALAHRQGLTAFAETSKDDALMEGVGVEMFTSGSAPRTTDMMSGDCVDLFTTSCVSAPESLSVSAGEGVQMFTTSCVTADSKSGGGDKVELFTTSC